MKIGIVGYQGSGKSTLFEWLSGEAADPALAHKLQSTMVPVPEPRVDALCEIYQPKKVTLASLELVDTPGLSRGHEDSAGKLALIREAGCMIVVVSAFGGNDAAADLDSFEEDLLLTDLDLVARRVERLEQQVKKARPDREEMETELAALLPLQEDLGNGKALRDIELTPSQQRVVRSFQLLTEKPRMVIVNVAEDDIEVDKYRKHVPEGTPLLAIPLDLEREMMRMEADERAAFYEEIGIQPAARDALLQTILKVSGQMLFFTAGDKEVRTWLLHQGGTAVEAAGSIHTDLANGFIRAETMQIDDLLRLGSERAVKAENRMRAEPKDYVIQDGDILLIRHS